MESTDMLKLTYGSGMLKLTSLPGGQSAPTGGLRDPLATRNRYFPDGYGSRDGTKSGTRTWRRGKNPRQLKDLEWPSHIFPKQARYRTALRPVPLSVNGL